MKIKRKYQWGVLTIVSCQWSVEWYVTMISDTHHSCVMLVYVNVIILIRERVRLRDSRDSRASRDFHGPCHDPRDSRDSRVPCVLRKKEKTPENRKIQEQAVHDKCHATGSCKNAMRASLHADALGRKEGWGTDTGSWPRSIEN
jgi:hypothetical protein